MHKGLSFLGGLGLGAAAMYVFDPDRGNRRRAFARDKMLHLVRTSERAVDKASRDLSHRAWGLVAEARSAIGGGEAIDMVVVDRVRSQAGRVVSHPHAIEVTARDGKVTLRGPVLAHEVQELLARVSGTRGVKEVENRLEVHQEPGNVPGLQGGSPHEAPWEPVQKNWSPAARVLAGAGGGLLGWAAARAGGFWGAAMGFLGFGLVTRAVTNMEMADLLGLETSEETERRASRLAGS